MLRIYSRIKSLLVHEGSELTKLELQHKKLLQKSLMLQCQGKIDNQVEVELHRVAERIDKIFAQDNQMQRQDSQLLQEAYAELDQEFPNIRSLLNRDRN